MNKTNISTDVKTNCDIFPFYFEQEISFKKLQRGYGQSYCEFLFSEVETAYEVDSIWCDLRISQDDEPPLNFLDFRMKYNMPESLLSKYRKS